MSVSDQDWEALRDLGNAFPVANANDHVLLDYLYPLHVRERRAVSSISRFDRSRPVESERLYEITYRMYYSVPGRLNPEGHVNPTEVAVKAYPGGVDASNRFWYTGNHDIDTVYLRESLAHDPSAKQCLAQAASARKLVYYPHFIAGRLGEWVPNVIFRKKLAAGRL